MNKVLWILRGILLALALLACVIVWLVGTIVVSCGQPWIIIVGMIAVIGVAIIDLHY